LERRSSLGEGLRVSVVKDPSVLGNIAPLPPERRHSSPVSAVPGLFLGNFLSGKLVCESNPDEIDLIICLNSSSFKYNEDLLRAKGVELCFVDVEDLPEKADELLEKCSGEEFDREDVGTWFKSIFGKIDDYTSRGKKILVHCHRGASRSATVVTAYLMFQNSWSFDKALKELVKSRNVVHPNLGFCELLTEFDQEIDKARRKTAKMNWDLMCFRPVPINFKSFSFLFLENLCLFKP
jgi:protein-tyrosine phosphatase